MNKNIKIMRLISTNNQQYRDYQRVLNNRASPFVLDVNAIIGINIARSMYIYILGITDHENYEN